MEDIRKIADLVARIRDYDKSANLHAHIRWWWRGQADVSWDPRPKVYRTDFPAVSEDERLLLERHLAQDFLVESASLIDGHLSDAESYFLQQHYGMPTRLLDWTNNALAALWFAVTEIPEKDGSIFLMDAYQLAVTQGSKPHYQGIVTMRHPWFQAAMKQIFEWNDQKGFPKFVMAIRPDQGDRRIGLQRSCFTFHFPERPGLTVAENSRLTQFRVPSDAKAEMKRDLLLLGIDEFSIYGDLEHLAQRLKRAHNIR